MNAIVNFDFEGHGIRTVMREDLPWFVAADICRVLDIANPRDAVTKLDDDEKGVALTDTLGGTQEMVIVSESGLYTIVLRCRDAVKPGSVPHRFRKWVTSEVLPALRKHGTYSLPAPRPVKVRGRTIAGMHPREVRAATDFVRTAQSLGGRNAGLEAWMEHSSLPRLKAFDKIRYKPWTGREALIHLLDIAAGDVITVGELVSAAIADKVKRCDLDEFGLRLLDLAEGTVLFVADDHHFLRSGFEGTDICYAWNDYLRRLPGAHRPQKPVIVDCKARRGVLVPITLIDDLRP